MLRYSNITEVATRCYVRKRPSPLPPACCFCMLLPFAFAYWPHVEYITICIYITRLQNAHPHNTTHNSNTPHPTRPVWVSPGCVWLVANSRVSIYIPLYIQTAPDRFPSAFGRVFRVTWVYIRPTGTNRSMRCTQDTFPFVITVVFESVFASMAGTFTCALAVCRCTCCATPVPTLRHTTIPHTRT